MNAASADARASARLVRWLFVRLVGAVFLVAFASLAIQIVGLVGRDGILPAHRLTEAVAARLGSARFWRMPTLVWWTGASDGALVGLCIAGAIAAIATIAGLAPMVTLVTAWACYLSLFHVGQEFLGFQWDLLLLEAGSLAVLWAPLAWRSRLASDPVPSRLGLWLVRLLVFKLMFLSGVVKLASGDAAWRDLSALTYHFETQPLPTWIGWFAHHSPRPLLVVGCATTLAIELVLPWAIFAGRTGRRGAFLGFAALMVAIGLTGNYTFFNALTLVAGLALLDDDDLLRVLPRRSRDRVVRALQAPAPEEISPARWARRVAAALLIVANVAVVLGPALGALGGPLDWVWRITAPFASVNGYGLFAVMTKDRPEVVIEGSDDGRQWREYVLPWKPGPLDRRPGFVEPHQPRLDWQLWFAALNPRGNRRWVTALLTRLSEGSPAVVALFAANPFPSAPPRFVRASLYRYSFTDWETLRRTGRWWTRELVQPWVTVPPAPFGADGSG
ncbi:MAG: lipase maturation factor family protein [bacterium]